MLRRLKKFAVCSSAIVVGQALDDAPFAGQDESKDAKGLLRQLSECEDASYVQIFGDCYDPATTGLRVPPASLTPGAARDRPSASQGPQRQPDHRPDPARDRPAHGAGVPASSPRAPDARRAARPVLGVAGTSTATRS